MEIVGSAIYAPGDRYLKLPVPKNLAIKNILDIYNFGGIIERNDVSVYARRRRNDLNISMRDLAYKVGLTTTPIWRLETGYERVLLKDILVFDQALSCNGALIALAWEAAEYETGIIINRAIEAGRIPQGYGYKDIEPNQKYKPFPWQPMEKAVADAMVAISRWYQVLGNGPGKWVRKLREFYLDPPEKKSFSVEKFVGEEVESITLDDGEDWFGMG
jgi:transcriptional regulator with XRE-family HTH domain